MLRNYTLVKEDVDLAGSMKGPHMKGGRERKMLAPRTSRQVRGQDPVIVQTFLLSLYISLYYVSFSKRKKKYIYEFYALTYMTIRFNTLISRYDALTIL